MTIVNTLSKSNYIISLITYKEIDKVEAKIAFRELRDKNEYFIKCLIMTNELKLLTEEIERQLYVKRMIIPYNHTRPLIQII